jgi:GntR family transcriptional regulator/MocR family aminotransferase
VFVPLVGTGPAYLRLFRGLRDAILGGRLAAGAALPSTRQLAGSLELSRNTVLRAYEQLIAEGLATARHGGGTFVAEQIVGVEPVAPVGDQRPIRISAEGQRTEAAVMQTLFVEISKLTPVPYDFLFGVPDASLFPIQDWRATVSRCIDRASKRSLAYDHPMGVMRLRELVAAHIVKHRGVRCHADHIAIVSGAQQAFDLLARVLLDPGDLVLVEDPCYPAIRAILQSVGACIVNAPVDAEGIDLEAVDRELRDRCRLVYVTPSHQFPSGAVMSGPRRRALLAWAARVGAVVIEDDYDGDYRHIGKPTQAIQGLDTARVVHVGTFSKSLFPSLRMAYLVLPSSLVMAFAAAKWIADWSSSALLQHALADFMERGYFTRHLKRSSAVYARRRIALLAAIKRELGNRAIVAGGDAGMHVVLWLPELAVDALPSLVARARSLGVGAYPVSAFCERTPPSAGLVLGYSGLSEQQIGEGIALLASAIRA